MVGSEATYTLTVSNDGPSEASGVRLVDPLPAGLTLVSATGAGWDCTGSTVTAVDCARPTFGVGVPSVVTLVVAVGADAYPSVSNTAEVTSATPDPDTDNNESTDVAPVPARVDLAITKSHTAAVVSVGDQLTYTLAVVNLGPTDDPATVSVLDELPTGLTFVSGTGDGWTCAAVGQTVTCERAGLEVGEAPDIALVVDVGVAAEPAVTNTASVTSPTTDIDPTNNSDDDPVDIRAVADLTLAKTISGTVVTGAPVSYHLLVTNQGPSTETGPIVVTDTLPAGLASPKASGDGWTCTADATVTCTRPGPLAAGESAPVIVLTATVTAAAGSTLVNEASVSGTTYDRDPANNAGVASAAVLAPGDLPDTGADVSRAVSFGVLLIGLGLVLVLLGSGRRRRV